KIKKQIYIIPKITLIHCLLAKWTSNKPNGIPNNVAIDSFLRIIGSLYFQPETAKNKATVKPTKPTNATAVENGIGSKASNGILTTESPKPNVERIREPKNTAPATNNISE